MYNNKSMIKPEKSLKILPKEKEIDLIMKKERLLDQLKQKKYRITKQRQLLLDVILCGECSSCKEIFYTASHLDSSIGKATVYRMVSLLEEMGVIDRKNIYKVAKDNDSKQETCQDKNEFKINRKTSEPRFISYEIFPEYCRVCFSDDSIHILSKKSWEDVIQRGLDAYHYPRVIA